MEKTPLLDVARRDLRGRTLRAIQVVGLDPAAAFAFFEDPKNLAAITPSWLDFKIIGDCGGRICCGSEYDYTIRWFGIAVPWRTRITEYTAGVSFTDSQIRGPYRSWVHRHAFRETTGGTLMEDRVDFELPLAALPLGTVITRQLEDIFSYRARRIAAWAAGEAA